MWFELQEVCFEIGVIFGFDVMEEVFWWYFDCENWCIVLFWFFIEWFFFFGYDDVVYCCMVIESVVFCVVVEYVGCEFWDFGYDY